MNNFAHRAEEVEALLANEELDVLLVCETLQKRLQPGIIPPLKFSGSLISMPAKKKSGRGMPGMEIAFFTKKRSSAGSDSNSTKQAADVRGAPCKHPADGSV